MKSESLLSQSRNIDVYVLCPVFRVVGLPVLPILNDLYSGIILSIDLVIFVLVAPMWFF